MNDLFTEILQRFNGKEYEKHDNKLMFAVNYFEVLDDGKAKLIVKPYDNPDYDPQYWKNLDAAEKGEKHESN